MCPQSWQPDAQTSNEEFETTVSKTTGHPPPRQEQPWLPDGQTLDEEFEDTVSEATQHLPPRQEQVYIRYQQGNVHEYSSDLNPNRQGWPGPVHRQGWWWRYGDRRHI